MEAIQGLLVDLWNIWMEMLKLIGAFLLRFSIFLLWFICGIIVLPCVFVAGNFYPKWTDWGEKI